MWQFSLKLDKVPVLSEELSNVFKIFFNFCDMVTTVCSLFIKKNKKKNTVCEDIKFCQP